MMPVIYECLKKQTAFQKAAKINSLFPQSKSFPNSPCAPSFQLAQAVEN